MVGESTGEGETVTWVQGARQAATRDLLAQLARQPLIERILLLSPAPDTSMAGAVDRVVRTPKGTVHVGRWLARVAQAEGIRRLFYCGGGAAPLLADATLASALEKLVSADQLIVANNRFATDWAALTPATVLDRWVERLPRDNMLVW